MDPFSFSQPPPPKYSPGGIAPCLGQEHGRRGKLGLLTHGKAELLGERPTCLFPAQPRKVKRRHSQKKLLRVFGVLGGG